MSEDTEMVHCWLVLVGRFNPAIFSPAWFAKNGLISDEQLEASETETVHPEITRFSIDHLTITCQKDRFQLDFKSEPAVHILDLALQLFGELLPHTPLSAFGLNYTEHWKTDSWERRMALGRALAPFEPWGAWGRTFDNDDPEKVGGLADLVMKKPYEDDLGGYRRAVIGPSKEISDKLRGVYLHTTHHREVKTDESDGSEELLKLLSAEFDDAIRQAKEIIREVKDFSNGLELGK